jgi:hypothetical protein
MEKKRKLAIVVRIFVTIRLLYMSEIDKEKGVIHKLAKTILHTGV